MPFCSLQVSETFAQEKKLLKFTRWSQAKSRTENKIRTKSLKKLFEKTKDFGKKVKNKKNNQQIKKERTTRKQERKTTKRIVD